MRAFGFLFHIGIAAALSACTQSPAEVVYKGEQAFTRDQGAYASYAAPSLSSGSFSAPSGASVHYSDATIHSPSSGSVSVSDLPPPASAPAASAPPAALKPESSLAPKGWKSSFAAEPKLSGATAATGQAFIRPVEGSITSHFGAQGKGVSHDGLIFAATEGEPVYASAAGEVIYQGDQLKGFGNMVIVRHAGNRSTTYAHLSRIQAERYARVKQGDIIGYVGTSGDAKKPQLYFALHEGTKPINPESLFGRELAALQ